MKIKICKENIEALKKVCAEANGKATTRTISAENLISAAENAENFLERKLHLVKTERKGIIFNGGYYNDFAKAYLKVAYPKGTLFEMVRGSKDWFLTNIERYYCNGTDKFFYTDKIEEIIKDRALYYAKSCNPIGY